jgi:hypothetical protein
MSDRRIRGQTPKRPPGTGQPVRAKKELAKSSTCKGENADLQNRRLYWIEVNSVTHKLTDGTMERTPTSHGQWGGYNIERGIAWCMETGWVWGKTAWFACYRDQRYGPTDLKTAKRAAIAFATGVEHLPANGLAMAFNGPVDLNAEPERAAEIRLAQAQREAADAQYVADDDARLQSTPLDPTGNYPTAAIVKAQ